MNGAALYMGASYNIKLAASGLCSVLLRDFHAAFNYTRTGALKDCTKERKVRGRIDNQLLCI